MRTVLLLPLALAAAAAGGCGTASDESRQTASRAPARDLTLREANLPEVAVASPVELNREPVQVAATHHIRRARKPAPAPRPKAVRPGPELAAPAPTPAPSEAAPVSMAAAESEAPDPHALAPGQTVTVLPASSGPTTAPPETPEWTDAQRGDDDGGISIGTGGSGMGGGRCNPRPGTGWAGGFRGLR